jgi:tetratricopeptide (TPR) repeat protein
MLRFGFLILLGMAAVRPAVADGYGDLLQCAELKEPLISSAILCSQALRSGTLTEPQAALALLYRGYIALQLEEYQNAIQDLSMSIQFNPDIADAYYYKGLAFEAQGEVGRADGQYRNAFLLAPEDPEILAKMRERSLLN